MKKRTSRNLKWGRSVAVPKPAIIKKLKPYGTEIFWQGKWWLVHMTMPMGNQWAASVQDAAGTRRLVLAKQIKKVRAAKAANPARKRARIGARRNSLDWGPPPPTPPPDSLRLRRPLGRQDTYAWVYGRSRSGKEQWWIVHMVMGNMVSVQDADTGSRDIMNKASVTHVSKGGAAMNPCGTGRNPLPTSVSDGYAAGTQTRTRYMVAAGKLGQTALKVWLEPGSNGHIGDPLLIVTRTSKGWVIDSAYGPVFRRWESTRDRARVAQFLARAGIRADTALHPELKALLG